MPIGEIKKSAGGFGCHDLVLLEDTSTPQLLEYLDLLKTQEETGLKIHAVAEFQSRPLLYIICCDNAGTLDKSRILDLQQILGNRGERAYLGILRPGDLEIRPVNLDRKKIENVESFIIKRDSQNAPVFFQSLVNDTFEIDGTPETADYVYDTIYRLMTASSEWLITKYKLNPLDVLSLIGRALFFRFLYDRKIILSDEITSVCPAAKSIGDCFSDRDNTIAICQWLDETFNGDLLPFSYGCRHVCQHMEKETDGELFLHLQAILLGWDHVGGGRFQPSLPINWDDLNFAHIPIGVLSQVYEKFSRVWDERQALDTSIFYTPKNIARYLVDDAFAGLKNKTEAKILDPSCGAGIFLVLAFRKLVAARWESDGKRPGTKVIQSILYRQLCGFDISESALRLAALSLYITAIELNDSPRPPKSLKFPRALQSTVLFNQRKPEEKDVKGFVMGSLRADLPTDFDGVFDIVIGNPPWTRIDEGSEKNKEFNAHFTSLTRSLLSDREQKLRALSEKYNNPDNDPDLPFLWRATRWAKPGGIIAMALPSRIFLKQSDSGQYAFELILKGIEVTGILNGSNLSDTDVWPGMNQPFMLLFARNKVPAASHCFYFVSPHYEKSLNGKGRMRIDYNAAHPVPTAEAIKYPWLLKTLANGTSLDVDVLKKIFSFTGCTIAEYWDQHGLFHGRGYDVSPNQKRQEDARFLVGKPDLSRIPKDDFAIDPSQFSLFGRDKVHAPREPDLYKPPMLIVPEAPGASPSSPKSFKINETAAFSKSYYGFSAYGSPRAAFLVSFLHLLTHSSLFRYYILMTSSRLGAERRTFLKGTLEDFPFPELDAFPRLLCRHALELSRHLETAHKKPWDEIDSYISEIYGLDKQDLQVVRDTLAVCWPFKASRDHACSYPTADEQGDFLNNLKKMLEPSFKITGEGVCVRKFADGTREKHYISPWLFFTVSTSEIEDSNLQHMWKKLLPHAIMEANRTGCSRITMSAKDMILVGILAQYRYWTSSRARLCAMHIIRNHLDVFPVGRTA